MQPIELKTLLYKSISKTKFGDGQDLDILGLSSSYNHSNGITGCLIRFEHSFMQVIEGRQSYIDALYDRIRRDERHEDVQILWESKIAQRNFPLWSMCFAAITDAREISNLEQFLVKPVIIPDDFETIAAYFKEVLKTQARSGTLIP